MTLELDQALLTGDADSINESLTGLELDEALLFGDDDEISEPTQANQTVVEPTDEDLPAVIDSTGSVPPASKEDVSEGAKAQGSDDPSGDAKTDLLSDGVREIDGQLYIPVDPKNAEVLGKGGKHTIPYALLESARKDAGAHKSRIHELEQELSQTRTQAQRAQLLEQQLEEAGITPDKLPEELLNDPEAIQSIKDEIGGQAGAVVAALIERFAAEKGASVPATTQQGSETEDDGKSVVADALNAPENAELNSWMNDEPDRWQMALIIDNKLKNDPEFQTMSLQERFTEVQRRVKASFGDPIKASIEQELQKKEQPEQGKPKEELPPEAQTTIPNSPSSLGGSPTDTKQAAHEALAAQDPMALETSLASMSPEEVEAFLANAAIALD